MKNACFGLLAMICAATGPGTALALQGARDPVRILERASGEFAALEGFCADFQQTLTSELLDQVTHSRGRMCQQQPDRFSMRFTDPGGDLIVADGEWLWIYFPSSDDGQVIRSAMIPGGRGRFDFHREFLSDPGTRYDPSYMRAEELDGVPAHVIRLVPRQPSAYREARVWIDERSWLIRRTEIEEENGNVREVQLAGFERNPRLASDAFRFTPPPGVQVITR